MLPLVVELRCLFEKKRIHSEIFDHFSALVCLCLRGTKSSHFGSADAYTELLAMRHLLHQKPRVLSTFSSLFKRTKTLRGEQRTEEKRIILIAETKCCKSSILSISAHN